MGVWFKHGERLFEVQEGSAEHAQLLASGAEPADAPGSEAPAKGRRKAPAKAEDG
jgi:hypothetical protein